MTFKNPLTPADWTRFNQLIAQQLHTPSSMIAKFWVAVLIGLMLIVMLAPMLIFSFSQQATQPHPPHEGIRWGQALIYAIPLLILLVLPRLVTFSIRPEHSLKKDGVVLGDRTISTEPAGIRITTNGSETLLYWPALESIHVAEDMMLIFMEPLVAYCVVRHSVPPADFDAFLQEIQMNAPQIRESFSAAASGT